MIDTNTNLSNRFFYVNQSPTSASDSARTFPMSRLIAMNMISAGDLRMSFDDSGAGDHTIVQILMTSGKGKEAIKDIVDAINSNQKIVVLADEFTGESIINDYEGGSVNVFSGSIGAFALNGNLSVAGSSTFNGSATFNAGIQGKRRTQHLDAADETAAPTVGQSGSILVFDGDACTVTLPTCAIGLEYTFLFRESHSGSELAIITTQASDKLFGSLIRAVDGLSASFADDGTQVDTTTGTDDNTMTMNGTTKGGIVGSRIQVTGLTANKWQVHGELIGSGNQITVFS